MSMEDWSLSKPPPEGHPDVGKFVWTLLEESVAEKERLSQHDRWQENYRLARGGHLANTTTRTPGGVINKLMVNLVGANINRTVANITARAPVAEVVDLDGGDDDAAEVLTGTVKKWNNESEQARLLSRSVLNMETYGITIEKAVYDSATAKSGAVIIDPYALIVAPGYYDEAVKVPYVGHLEELSVEAVRSIFGIDPNEEIEESGPEEDTLLGREREDVRPTAQGIHSNVANYPGNYSDKIKSTALGDSKIGKNCIVVEIWVRDWCTEEVPGEVSMAEDGSEVVEMVERHKYPGGWRVISVTNDGKLVLADRPNPNINDEIPREQTRNTYLYNNHPYYWANSYEDTTSIWGFAAAEQVGDINLKINEMLSRLAEYLNRVASPAIILPQDSGVFPGHLNNEPGLCLQPSSTAVSTGIRFLPVPNLPSNFFDALNLYISFFDRVSQIEDADRGVAPNGVIAASAIVSLQERNQVMVQAKIMSVDYLVRQRGRCAISFLQNFGVEKQRIEMDGESVEFVGIDLAGRKFNYIVESGSTVARTSLQIQEQAVKLYEQGAIDRQAYLETLNFPGWKSIIERVGEGQLNQAMQVLIQAGLPEEEALALQQYLMEPQGGPGNTGKTAAGGQSKQPRPGTPKGQQQ